MRRDPCPKAHWPRALSLLFAGALIAAGAVNGCGSRGPLDDTPSGSATADADIAETAPPVDVPDATTDTGRPRDGQAQGNPIACGLCVIGQCSQNLIQCIQSPGCRTVFQCVATKCLGLGLPGGDGGGGGGGGGLNPLCLFGCAGNDPAGALEVLTIFQCVTGKCGDDCGSLLGGLGNLPGGGGGGGGGSSSGGSSGLPGVPGDDNRMDRNVDRQAFQEIFSRWPELYTPAVPPAR